MSGCQFKKILLSLFVLICYYTQVFSIEKGDLIWKSCTGWGVHSIVPTGDINGDWISDLFVGSGNDVIFCFSGAGPSGKNRIWSFPVGSDVWTVTSLEDVNGDGINDCLAGTGDNMIYCLSGSPLSGETYVIWLRRTGGDVWSVAPINDLNGDGINDCIAGTGTDSVYCLSGVNGNKIWAYKDSKVGAMKTVTSIADLDGNGKDECLAGGENDKVICISSKGKVIWYYLTKSTVLSTASIEDVTGDGYADCLIGGEDDYVYCISGKSSGNANYYWRKKTGSTIKSVSQIADANGDNYPDCLAGGQDDKIYCLSGRNGNIIWEYKTKSTVLSVKTIPDVNGNGGEDCIAGGEDNYVYCIDGKSSGTGSVYWRSKIIGSVTCVSAITDLNGNGAPDVISGSDDSYVYVFEGGKTIPETISAPDIPTGPSSGKVGQSLSFNVGGSISNLDHHVEYRFSWGDGSISEWGTSPQSKTYHNVGICDIKAQARCVINKDKESNWSPIHKITLSGHTLKVSFSGSGSVTKNPVKSEYNHNENVTLTAEPVTGYQFDNWGGDLSGSNNPASITMNNNKNITAYFSKASETVTTPSTPTGSSSGKVGQDLSFSIGGSSSNLGHTVEYCFNWGDGTFSDWGSSSRNHSYTNVGNYTVKAQARCKTHNGVVSSWSKSKSITLSGHALNVSIDGGGNVTKNPNKNEYNHNENVMLNATPDSYHQFNHWEGDVNGNSSSVSVAMNNDKIITAYFRKILEIVSVPSTPTGLSSGNVGQMLNFSTGNSTSNHGHNIEYCFNWGDGNISDWGSSSQENSWSSAGNFVVKARARCSKDTSIISEWSEGLTVNINSTGVNRLESAEIPSNFQLLQNYPNPFNSETCITFHLPQQCDLKFEIFNIYGELISAPADGFYTAGVYRVNWDGKMLSGNSAPSGLYVYRLRADKFNSTKLMMLLK